MHGYNCNTIITIPEKCCVFVVAKYNGFGRKTSLGTWTMGIFIPMSQQGKVFMAARVQ
jgi:hypothetical protein